MSKAKNLYNHPIPSLKRYYDGKLPTYYYTKVFNTKGVWHEKGDMYDTYGNTYDELIWRLGEGVIK